MQNLTLNGVGRVEYIKKADLLSFLNILKKYNLHINDMKSSPKNKESIEKIIIGVWIFWMAGFIIFRLI